MHIHVLAVPQYSSRYSDKQTCGQEEKKMKLKSKTKKSQAFVPLSYILTEKKIKYI